MRGLTIQQCLAWSWWSGPAPRRRWWWRWSAPASASARPWTPARTWPSVCSLWTKDGPPWVPPPPAGWGRGRRLRSRGARTRRGPAPPWRPRCGRRRRAARRPASGTSSAAPARTPPRPARSSAPPGVQRSLVCRYPELRESCYHSLLLQSFFDGRIFYGSLLNWRKYKLSSDKLGLLSSPMEKEQVTTCGQASQLYIKLVDSWAKILKIRGRGSL